MVSKKLFQEWIDKAGEDFGFASLCLKDFQTTYYTQICFHFQQAAEKYLKAYIVAYELEFKKIHELTELLNICQKHNPLFEVLSDDCFSLLIFT